MMIYLMYLLNILLARPHLATQTFLRPFHPQNEIFRGQPRNITQYEYLRSFPGAANPWGMQKPGQTRYKRKTDEESSLNMQRGGLEDVTELQTQELSTVEVSTDNSSTLNDMSIENDQILNVDRVKIFGGEDQASMQHPFWLLVRPIVKKLSGVVSYLTHPNVALTPWYFLRKLKQKFYEHVKDKIEGYSGDFQEYPYPYRFN